MIKHSLTPLLHDLGPPLDRSTPYITGYFNNRDPAITKLKRELRAKEEKLNQSLHLVNFIARKLDQIYLSLSQAEHLFSLQKNASLTNGTQLCVLLFKPIRSTINVSINAFKLYRYRHVRQQLLEMEKNHEFIATSYENKDVIDCFIEFNYKIREQKRASREEIKTSFRQFGSACAKITISLNRIKTLIHKTGYSNQIETAASSLKNLMSFWKDYDKWQKARKIHAILEDWKRSLEQSKGPDEINIIPTSELSSEKICATQNLFPERKKTFEYHLKTAQTLVAELVTRSREQSFDMTVQDFASYHVDLTSLKNAPLSQKEWLRKINNPHFINKLCKQRAEYVDAQEMMMDKAFRCVTIKKLEHEQKLIFFQKYEFLLGMAIQFIEICLYFPYMGSKWIVRVIAKYILSSLPLMNIRALKLINPDLNLSPIGIAIVIISYLYHRTKRPNAYSWKAYRLQFAIDLSKYIFAVHQYFYQLQVCVLIVKIQLIEKKIFRSHNHELEADKRYKDLILKIEASKTSQEHYLLHLKEQLKNLDLKDAEILLNHQGSKTENEYKILEEIELLSKEQNISLFTKEKDAIKYAEKDSEEELFLIQKLVSKAQRCDLLDQTKYEFMINQIKLKEYKRQYRGKHKNNNTIQILGEALAESYSSVSNAFSENIKKKMGIDLTQYQQKEVPYLISEFYSQRGSVLAKFREDPTNVGWKKFYKIVLLPK